MDNSFHIELHQELSRHDGSRLDLVNRYWSSLVPMPTDIDVGNAGGGGGGYAPVRDSRCAVVRKFFRLWFSLKDKHDWTDFPALVSQFAGFSGPVSFLRMVDSNGMSNLVGVDAGDAPGVPHALKSCFPRIFIEEIDRLSVEADWLAKGGRSFRWGFFDFRPSGSYFGRFRIPPKNAPGPMTAADLALADVVGQGFACIEVICHPERIGFRNNMRAYLALAESSAGLGIAGRSVAGGLAHDLSAMAGLKEKLADEAPIFFTAVRCLVASEPARFEHIARAVTAPLRAITCGDRPLRCLTHEDYRSKLDSKFPFMEMLGSGRVVAPGFPATATELAILCHLPPQELLEDSRYPFDRVRGIDYRPSGKVDGIYIGDNVYGNKEKPVIQAWSLRRLHTAVCGSTGMGKSTVMVHMARQLMERC